MTAGISDDSEPEFLRATRLAYDTVAEDYAVLIGGMLADQPLERAMLGVFAELVRAEGAGPVADLGCGPGHLTARLAGLGLQASGIDLSPGMVAVARRTYPHLRFDQGSLLDPDLDDGVLAGALAWYSLIHIPPPRRPEVFAHLHRVLRPGGHLLIAFQVGDHVRHLEHGYGHPISLDAYRMSPDRIVEELAHAGLTVHARLITEPRAAPTGLPAALPKAAPTPQAFLLARKPRQDEQ